MDIHAFGPVLGFHQTLAKNINQTISRECKIQYLHRGRGLEERDIVRLRGGFECQLYCLGTGSELAWRERGETQQFVARIAPGWWAGWWEAWQKPKANRYQLYSAGWTFYAGRPINPLIRAERALARGKHAQPHWHVDLGASSSAAEGDRVWPEVVGDLKEIEKAGAPGPQDRLSAFHLGMAGWSFSNKVPHCWQWPAENPGQIAEWSHRTLGYMLSQIRSRRV